MDRFNLEEARRNPTGMPDAEASAQAEEYLQKCIENQDSAGGVVSCKVHGMPAGIGEPVFDKLDACLGQAVMSIGAVKAFAVGDGCEVSKKNGSTNNDAFCNVNGQISKKTNHAGGILGGISDGSDIILRAYFKPTPSIYQKQQTVNQAGEEIEIQIKGRHDPIVVSRAVVVVEAMTAVTILDELLRNMTSRLDGIKEFYHK